MKAKLTKKLVDTLGHPESGQVFVWDTALMGFGIRLTRSRKTYIVQGRVNGKERRTSIGVHGVITAERARERALAVLSGMVEGVDPVDENKRLQAARTTLKQAAEQYVKLKRTRKGLPLKKSTIADITRHIDTTFEGWADKPIAKITPAMVDRLYQDRLENSPAQAVQAFRVLRAIYNWQRANTETEEGEPTLPENPCRVIAKRTGWAHIQPKNRMVPLARVGAAWNKLTAVYNDPGQTRVGQTMAAAVMFCWLTAARWGELAPLTWKQIDLDAGTWHLPDPKNRVGITLPLSKQAVNVLRGQEGLHKQFVFPGRSKAGHVYRPERVMVKVTKICGVRVSPHDLRRTWNAIAEDCGIEFWKRKALLGHKLRDITLSSYTETNHLGRLQPDVQLVADWIELKAKIASKKNVVAMKRRAS
jgi:integrase